MWAALGQKLGPLGDKSGALLANEDACSTIRHLVMRWSLGAVLVWFAVQQLYDPADWAHFVPSFMQGPAGIPETALIRLHGTLLLAAGVGLLAGAGVRLAAGLASFILAQIIAALLIEGGEANVIARDLGLLGLALGLVLDSTRVPAFELPSALTSVGSLREQPFVRPPTVAPSQAGGPAAYAVNVRAAKGPGVAAAGARPSRNGDVTASKPRAIAGTRLRAKGEGAAASVAGVSNAANAERGDGTRSDPHMVRLAETIIRLTWVIAGLAVVNLIALLVRAVAA